MGRCIYPYLLTYFLPRSVDVFGCGLVGVLITLNDSSCQTQKPPLYNVYLLCTHRVGQLPDRIRRPELYVAVDEIVPYPIARVCLFVSFSFSY